MKTPAGTNVSIHQGAIQLAIKISQDLRERVWGYVNVSYNSIDDSFYIKISNRVFNSEPFHFYFNFVSNEMARGTSSSVISQYILNEYRDYVNMYIYKKH